MKKTTLLLLTSCALAGCYTSPEMTENKYRDFYSDTSICGTSTMYQNKELRECIENSLADEDQNKKTVSILPLPNGDTLVVPKTDDDAELKDVKRVYEVVDIKTQSSVVIENGQMTEKITEVDVLVSSSEDQTVQEITIEEEIPQIEEVINAEEKIIEDLIDEEQLGVVEELIEEQAQSTDEAVIPEETEVIEIEETSETVVEKSFDETTLNGMADGVTLVVGPLKEDLVIEVKSAGQKKKTVETKTTKTQTKTIQSPVIEENAQKIDETREKQIAEGRKKAEERRKLQKKQKEVLPIEEK